MNPVVLEYVLPPVIANNGFSLPLQLEQYPLGPLQLQLLLTRLTCLTGASANVIVPATPGRPEKGPGGTMLTLRGEEKGPTGNKLRGSACFIPKLGSLPGSWITSPKGIRVLAI